MNLDQTNFLLDKTVDLIKTYLEKVHNRQRKVVNFHEPEKLKELFDFAITKEGSNMDEILTRMQDIADYSVANQHPRFFDALWAGADIYGIVGEWLTSVMGTTMYTYELAPLFTLMETYIFQKIATRVGWNEQHAGLMQPGGTTSNLMGMQLARYALDPSIHTSGLFNKSPLVIFTSDEAHYSISKNAMVMGLGKDHIIKVKTDTLGRMLVDDLEQKITTSLEQGQQPFMINATSGTTVLGAYDDLQAISHVAKKYDIWMHVDAAWGGTVLFHDKLRYKVSGLELADSFTRNPHKMMGTPLQCSIFMTRHPQYLSTCNTLKSKYLFNDDKSYDACYDTGDTYIQCGRRVDIVKLWLQWKASGDTGIAERITLAFDHTAYLTKKIQAHPHLYLLQDPACTNVCFWYIPTHLHSKINSLDDIRVHHDELHQLTAKIQSRMIRQGDMMSMYTNTKGLPNFIRMIVISPHITKQDLDFVVDHIVELGDEILHKWIQTKKKYM